MPPKKGCASSGLKVVRLVGSRASESANGGGAAGRETMGSAVQQKWLQGLVSCAVLEWRQKRMMSKREPVSRKRMRQEMIAGFLYLPAFLCCVGKAGDVWDV